MTVNAITLAQELIKCASVTPAEAGALSLLQTTLSKLGFICHRLPFGDGPEQVDNLYARWGQLGPNLCFAGHTDVVPAGDEAAWRHPPFSAIVNNDVLYGRGAVDMKTAIACFIAAFEQVKDSISQGSISLLITGDEEGPGLNGTKKVLQWLQDKGEIIDACIVGEPTSSETVGDTIKIGRRGSMGGSITVTGKQGHVAYPHLADNPIPRLLAFLDSIQNHTLDKGTADFSASNLEVTSIDVNNPTGNVIPATARANFNIRFNTHHTGDSLCCWLQKMAEKYASPFSLELHVSGEPFHGPTSSNITQCVAQSIQNVTGQNPAFSTSGGTSDARFIHKICPVVECGLLSKTAHQIDECVTLQDIEVLSQIYEDVLGRFFNN